MIKISNKEYTVWYNNYIWFFISFKNSTDIVVFKLKNTKILIFFYFSIDYLDILPCITVSIKDKPFIFTISWLFFNITFERNKK